MKVHIFLILLGMVVGAVSQGVTDKISPQGDAPEGCVSTIQGQFQISILETGITKRGVALQARGTCASEGILTLQLNESVLTDAYNRTGYIASNFQFQFDEPPQAGAIYTAGFSVCGNGSLAFGPSTIFWRCRSGTFWNLYDRWFAEQCEPAEIVVLPCEENPTPPINQGTVVETRVVTTTIIAPLSDGQAQVVTTTTAILICQIDDGQVQAHETPCEATVATSVATYNAPPVSQYSDGQIQVTAVGSASESIGQPTTTSGPIVVPTSAPQVAGATSVRAWVVNGGVIRTALAVGVAMVFWVC